MPLLDHLKVVYGDDDGALAFEALNLLIDGAKQAQAQAQPQPQPHGSAACADAHRSSPPTNFNRPCLIAYADSLVPRGAGALAAQHRDTPQATNTPLQLLARFMDGGGEGGGDGGWGPGSVSAAATFPVLHILPFYPWDTDRGFSVQDYRAVDPRNGSWDDVARVAAAGGGTATMFDFVANHASVDNPLVQDALVQRHVTRERDGDAVFDRVQPFRDFVIAFDEATRPSDEVLARLARPRANPVLTPYFVVRSPASPEGERYRAVLGVPEKDGAEAGLAGGGGGGSGSSSGSGSGSVAVIGKGVVWTTFSRGPDPSTGLEGTRQVDLNFANWRVLVEVVSILVEYVIARGASIIRLDAVGYVWKVLGRSSIHEPNAHRLITIMRLCLRAVSSDTVMIAEVNEPNSKLVPYLGDLGAGGEVESDMVYQFASYPMATHAVLRETARFFGDFVRSTAKFHGRQYITLLGSHDGMAMKQAAELLPAEEMQFFGSRLGTAPRSCLVNYARLPGGRRVVYECCGTPWSAINGRVDPGVPGAEELARRRYLAVIALGQVLRGQPAVYILGMLCSENFANAANGGLDENRSILRERLEPDALTELVSACHGLAEPRYAAVCRAIRATSGDRVARFFSSRAPPPDVLVADEREGPGGVAVAVAPADDGVLCVRLLADDSSAPANTASASSHLFVLINVTRQCQTVTLRAGEHEHARERVLTDVSPPAPGLASAPTLTAEPGAVACQLPAYGVAWLLETDAETDADADAGDSVPFCRTFKRTRTG